MDEAHDLQKAPTMRQRLSLLFLLFMFVACNQVSLTTQTHSSRFNSKQEKIEFLQKYLRIPSTYTELEYDINYQDNSTGLVPGPSDWDIKLKATIPKADLQHWIKGCTMIAPPKIDWPTLPFQVSDYEWYAKTGVLLGVKADKNEIIYQNTSMPS